MSNLHSIQPFIKLYLRDVHFIVLWTSIGTKPLSKIIMYGIQDQLLEYSYVFQPIRTQIWKHGYYKQVIASSSILIHFTKTSEKIMRCSNLENPPTLQNSFPMNFHLYVFTIVRCFNLGSNFVVGFSNRFKGLYSTYSRSCLSERDYRIITCRTPQGLWFFFLRKYMSKATLVCIFTCPSLVKVQLVGLNMESQLLCLENNYLVFLHFFFSEQVTKIIKSKQG